MGTLYLVLSLCVLQVHSMAIKGPVLTRYQPCGLDVIYFDKITDKLWRAEITLELYQNLQKVEIEIDFERRMTLYGVSHNSTVIINNRSHNFTFKPKGNIPNKYAIYTSVNETNAASEIPTVKSFRLNEMLLCNELVKAGASINDLDATQPDDEEYRHVCGRRSLNHSEVNSVRTDAVAGDWPWHVAILIIKPLTEQANYQCGGNVISTTAILTAAHCMFLSGSLVDTRRIVIAAGVTDLLSENQPGMQMLVAEKVILHPSYNIDSASSDLAIVVVNKLRYTEYVQPICVWGPVYDKSALFGKQAVITGFGTTEQDVLSNTLRATNTMIQNDATCIRYSPELYTRLLNEFTFCVGYGPNSEINPRNGDSGGGLVVPTKQPDHRVSWFLRGILSKCGLLAGETLCDTNFYVVYTDVGPHYSWIYHNAGLQYSSNVVS